MTAPSRDITPFDDLTPRRAAIRTMGAAGATLLSIVGLGAAQAQSNTRAVDAENRRTRKTGKCRKIGLTSAVSESFSLGANEGVAKKALCPDGFISISGGLQGESEVTAPCMIRESHPEPDGSAWVVNVFCTEATNTDLRVGVVCFSRRSFEQQGQRSFHKWVEKNLSVLAMCWQLV